MSINWEMDESMRCYQSKQLRRDLFYVIGIAV